MRLRWVPLAALLVSSIALTGCEQIKAALLNQVSSTELEGLLASPVEVTRYTPIPMGHARKGVVLP